MSLSEGGDQGCGEPPAPRHANKKTVLSTSCLEVEARFFVHLSLRIKLPREPVGRGKG